MLKNAICMKVLKSYLLRLEIPIYNCTSLVLQGTTHMYSSDCNIVETCC